MFPKSNMDNCKNKSFPSPHENDNYNSSSDEDDGYKIRVGKDYQAVVPDLIPESERNLDEYMDKALLVWSPTIQISDNKVDEYIHLAKDKYGYNGEQALGMLFWHKHDLQQAMNDLANFTPFPEEWAPEDEVLFEQAFQFHGKNFQRIKLMLPEKSMATLVKFYYSWKKKKSKTSLMDRQVKRHKANNLNEDRSGGPSSDHGSEGGSNSDSDSDDKKWIIHRGIRRESSSPPKQSCSNNNENSKDKDNTSSGLKQHSCSNCGVLCSEIHTTTKGFMCKTCAIHFKKTGNPRPTIGPAKSRADRHFVLPRNKRTPPRGMYINHDDLVAIASESDIQADNTLKKMDRELLTLKRMVQSNKQNVSLLKNKSLQIITPYQELVSSNHRINSQWSNDEILLAVQGIRNFGKDFQAIADIIRTKTKAHVKSFYQSYRKRFDLDLLLQDHEKEYTSVVDGNDNSDIKSDKIDVDGMSSDSDGTPVSNISSPTSPITNLNNTNKAQTVVAAK